MAKNDDNCHCPCFCDPTVPRSMEQTAARYNDRSAFANNSAQDNFVHMQANFLAVAQNQLEKHGLADMIMQMRAIQGQPAGA